MKEYLLFLFFVGSFPALSVYAKDSSQEKAMEQISTIESSESFQTKEKDLVEKEPGKDPSQNPIDQDRINQDKIDEIITNAQLRAQLGSKSRWSFKSNLGYNGGPLSNAFGRIRSNFNDKANNDLTGFVGGTGLNYRINESDNLSAGINIKMKNPSHIDPFSNDFENPHQEKKETSARRYDVGSLTIEWDRAYNLANLQAVTSVNYSHVTDQTIIDDLAALGSTGFKQTILAVLEESRWSVGASLFLNYFLYSGPRSAKAKRQNLPQQDFDYELSPFAEYSFNDAYSFKTVLAYVNFVHYQTRGAFAEGTIQAQIPYQSIGVGISVHRDIYFYPHIQFSPFNIRSDRTAIALNTHINLSLF